MRLVNTSMLAATAERPAMTDDIDAIVRGLSTAQREALEAVGPIPRGKAAISMAHVLKRAGFVHDPLVNRLTPLGIAVRDRIMAQKGGGV